jgi:hypothetical protein
MESVIIAPGKKHKEFKELSGGISGRILRPSIHSSIHIITPLPYIIAQQSLQYLITYSGGQ